MNKISGKWYGNNINLVFNANPILLCGDSGVGKTYIREYLQSHADSNIVVYDYTWLNRIDEIFVKMKESKNMLFVFDNADLLLTDDLRVYISTEIDNQYLLIGREPDLLHLDANNVKKLIFENNTFSFAPYIE